MKIIGLQSGTGQLYDFDITYDRITVESMGETKVFDRIKPPADDPKGGEFYNAKFAARVTRELGIYLGSGDSIEEGLFLYEALCLLPESGIIRDVC